MHIVISGSVATDHLMTFPGKFSEVFLPDRLAQVAVSVLVDDLVVRRGGVGANICFGMSQLGCPSVLFAAVGSDFDAYRAEYETLAPRVDLNQCIVETAHRTARFTCTTDTEQAQVASFYPGAMAAASRMSLRDSHAQRAIDLAVISPNAPDAMLAHTAECRELGIPFIADPSQQVSSMDGTTLRELITGARYVFSNDYEAEVIERKTGWSREEVLAQVDAWVITHADRGASVERAGAGAGVHVAAVPSVEVADPTGAGDAFRAGFLTAQSWGCSEEQACQVGSVNAAYALEAVGPQGYSLDRASFLQRLAAAYSSAAADAISQAWSAEHCTTH